VISETAKAADKLGLKEAVDGLSRVIGAKHLESSARIEALKALASLDDSKLEAALDSLKGESSETIKKEVARLQGKVKSSNAGARYQALLESGSTGEKQAALTALATLNEPIAEQLLNNWMDRLLEGKAVPEIQLELLEAAQKKGGEGLAAKVKKFEQSLSKDDPAIAFSSSLAGGNAVEGRKIFFEKAEASCLRCHKVGNEGGEVGPNLSKIGTEKTRAYILGSIVAPNKEIAQGYETTVLSLKDERSLAGIIKSETDTQIILNTPEDGLVTVKKSEISGRDKGLSSMPDGMGQVLSGRELRDLVEFLANQK
jgi:quinoprotein glucose dehydrogenase